MKSKQILLVCLFLTIALLAVFWRVNQCDFINFDDPTYVTENTHIRHGITMEAIRWAFTTGYAGNWHPMTWMSHMLDVQLFGLNPHRHHLTNLLFHIANTLLLFFAFCRMTKQTWKSAFVAALFAIHPLHVESVAWISERKDVLSTFFWMLTMLAYIHYVERPRLKNYLAVLIFFALGLMAKPMLVTLPFVLLFLDYWPLRRFEEQGAGSGEQEALKYSGLDRGTGSTKKNGAALSAHKTKGKSSKKRTAKGMIPPSAIRPPAAIFASSRLRVKKLLAEKIPLFVLAALSCMVTYVVQQKGGAIRSEEFPAGVRIANAFVSYIIYIGKTIWPEGLAVYYPHPMSWPFWQVPGAVLLIIAVTVTVIRTAKRFPYLTSGWLWFAGTLVPVIGIVQVGRQAMADRYTYIPLIGLFIMAAWGIPELFEKWKPARFPTSRKETLFAASALVLVCLFVVTWTQVGYWRNNITLYDHTLNVTSRNDTILNNRGNAHEKLGNHELAISDYDRAVEINPHSAEAYNNRGVVYLRLGNHMRAISDCTRAIQIYPEYADAYGNLGTAYFKLGDYRQAILDFDRAIEINSESASAYGGRGKAYGKLGNNRQAISDYDRAIEIEPEYAEAYNNRGVAFSILGDNRQAISDYDRAIEIYPEYADAHYNRAVVYGQLGNHRQAISDYDRVIEIDPKYAEAYNNRGVAYEKLGDRRRAIEDLQKAARFDNEDAKNSLRSIGIGW